MAYKTRPYLALSCLPLKQGIRVSISYAWRQEILECLKGNPGFPSFHDAELPGPVHRGRTRNLLH